MPILSISCFRFSIFRAQSSRQRLLLFVFLENQGESCSNFPQILSLLLSSRFFDLPFFLKRTQTQVWISKRNSWQFLPKGLDHMLARFLVRSEKPELKRNLLGLLCFVAFFKTSDDDDFKSNFSRVGLVLILIQIRPREQFDYEPFLDALKPSLMAIELDVRMAGDFVPFNVIFIFFTEFFQPLLSLNKFQSSQL